MTRFIARASFLALVCGLVACGQSRPDPAGGSLGQALQVSPTASVSTANYAVSGPNGFASAGTVPVGESPDVPIVLSHLPVGQNYQLELSALASDGVIVCDGATTFDVTDSEAAVTLVVHLACAVPSGELDLAATFNICPVLDELSASPLQLAPGGVSTLIVAAHDSDVAPAPLAYSWRVNGVRLTRQTAATLSFSCSSVGNVTIAATVSDGDPDPACAATDSVTVGCQ